jgi:hypothetical protein
MSTAGSDQGRAYAAQASPQLRSLGIERTAARHRAGELSAPIGRHVVDEVKHIASGADAGIVLS